MSQSLFARFLAGLGNKDGNVGEVQPVREDNALPDEHAEPHLPVVPSEVSPATE